MKTVLLAYLIVAFLCMVASLFFAFFMAWNSDEDMKNAVPVTAICLCVMSILWPAFIFGVILAMLDEGIRRKKGD